MISLQTLKERTRKKRGGKQLLVDRFFARPLSIYGTWFLVQTSLTANQVTVISMILMLAGAVCVGLPPRAMPVPGAVLLLFGYILDCCDGEIARFRNQTSLRGVYLDTLAHALTIPTLFLTAGVGVFLRVDAPLALIAGAFAAIASTNPAQAALTVLKNTAGTTRESPAPETTQPVAGSKLKSFYLKTLGRLTIFPNSMFIICGAIFADAALPVAERGVLYAAIVFYAIVLAFEQAAAVASWSREERLAQEVQQ